MAESIFPTHPIDPPFSIDPPPFPTSPPPPFVPPPRTPVNVMKIAHALLEAVERIKSTARNHGLDEHAELQGVISPFTVRMADPPPLTDGDLTTFVSEVTAVLERLKVSASVNKTPFVPGLIAEFEALLA